MGEQAQYSFLFADLSGFTALTEAHGDEEAADLVGEFVAEVRALLPEHQAEEIKCIGDAVMIRCDDAAQAVRLGVRIVTVIGDRHGFPMVRVGIDTGSAAERDGDWFGATVNLAARVAGAAVGGEVLITEATRIAADAPDGIHFMERGRRALKNLTEPVQLIAAMTEGEVSARRAADRPGVPDGRRPEPFRGGVAPRRNRLLLLFARLRSGIRQRSRPLRQRPQLRRPQPEGSRWLRSLSRSRGLAR